MASHAIPTPITSERPMSVVETQEGHLPIILGLPHTGTQVELEVWDRLNENGRKLADTDWHIHQLYDGLLPGVTTVRALFHRYVIDANRDPEGGTLYPGQNTTGLIPETDFEGRSIWLDNAKPTQNDIDYRRLAYHRPYHLALAAQITRLKAIHGAVIVFDCHSIRSRIAYLFDGVLPDFNIGTNDGASCAPRIEKATFDIAAGARDYTHTLNGRFKGGWTTRHYGRPADHVHAIQLELAQSTHLATETAPFAYDAAKADRLRVHLKLILERLLLISADLKR